MSLRPRYSLLTLLILTALIAGGVKVWRGPHHVVEWTRFNLEDEYSYLRTWDGSQIREGIRVQRAYQDGKISLIEIQYYHQGVAKSRACFIDLGPGAINSNPDMQQIQEKLRAFPDPECEEWIQTLERERAKVISLRHAIYVWDSN